jgi:hypothetical protein
MFAYDSCSCFDFRQLLPEFACLIKHRFLYVLDILPHLTAGGAPERISINFSFASSMITMNCFSPVPAAHSAPRQPDLCKLIFIHLYIYTHIYIYIYVYVYAHMYIYTYMYTYIYINTYIYMYIGNVKEVPSHEFSLSFVGYILSNKRDHITYSFDS